MSPRSIRFRLAAWFTVLLAAILLTAAIGAWFALRESIHATAGKDLKLRMAAMHGFLEKLLTEQDNVSLQEELEEEAALSPAGAVFRIANSGKWIYQSGQWNASDPASDLDQRILQSVVIAGKPFRVLAEPFRSGSEVWRVEIATPLEELYELLEHATITASFASPVLLLLAALGGYWLAGRVLSPVDSITRTAQNISASSLAERLPLSGNGDELDRLSGTLNAMLERLGESFERIQKFSADASHELRTPVAIMRTTAELALSKPRTDEQYQQALSCVLRESERVSRLIDDLLTLARAESSAEVLGDEAVELQSLLADASADMQLIAEARQIAIVRDCHATCWVEGDAAALRRLVVIILDNAVKFTNSGGTVSIKLDAGTISISDTGQGIQAEDLPRIFDRFYRPGQHRSRGSGGVGLGLAIAKHVVELHQGRFLVESTPGVGTTVQIILPVSANLQSRR